jgi:hypothetical protein
MISEHMGVKCKGCGIAIPVERICINRATVMTTMPLHCKGCDEWHEYGYQDECRFSYDDDSREVTLTWSFNDSPPLPPSVGNFQTL